MSYFLNFIIYLFIFFFVDLGHFLSHIQCTPPPPAYLDLFPKPCKNTFDCLPKVCCREAANQNFCRPPKKNVVGLLAAVLKVIFILIKTFPKEINQFFVYR